MKFSKIVIVLLSAAAYAAAQTPTSSPDEVLLKDGERVLGQVQSADSGGVTIKSSALGTLTIKWADVQSLHSARTFVAVPKGVNALKDSSSVAKGTVSEQDSKLQVASQSVPVSNLSILVPERDYAKATGHQGFGAGWKGGATAGISVTEATQTSQTYTAALNLVRTSPTVSWLAAKDRTIFNFNEAYGEVTQPNTPSVKTSITHGDLEQDFYLTPRAFVFGSAALDHNFSQGLTLQQNYGGGFGWAAVKTEKQELDLRGSADYVNQQFVGPTPSNSLIASSFGETYNRKLPRKILFSENLVFTPAWNNTHDYSASGGASLTFPVYKKLGFTTAVLDTFLNDPAVGFKKNSFQFTAGATYTFR